jgi:hypothetical protein
MPHSKTRFCICAALSLLAPLCRATTYNCDVFPISGASAVRANGINSSGIAVGYYTVGDPTTNNHTNYGFILNVNTGAIATITYPASGSVNTELYSINNNGVIVGRAYPLDSSAASSGGYFTRDASGNFALITLPSQWTISRAYGINDSGAISVLVFQTGSTFAQTDTYGILNPDGTLTTVPGANTISIGPGDLSNSSSMLEDTSFNSPAIAGPNGVIAQLNQLSAAYGLNNAGVVAGFRITSTGNSPPPDNL